MYQWLIAAVSSVVALIVSAIAAYENFYPDVSKLVQHKLMWAAIVASVISATVALLASAAELGYPLM